MASAGEKSLAVGHIPGFQIDPKRIFIPLYCYAHFAEKVHPLRNALIRYGVTFDNNVANLVTLGICPAPLPIRFIRVYREFVNFQRTAESACILQNAGGLCWGCAACPNPSAVRNRRHMILYRVDPLTITLDVVI